MVQSNVVFEGRRGSGKILKWLVANGCPQEEPVAAVQCSTLQTNDAAAASTSSSSGDESCPFGL
jgi:hypothetical protein